ncbi:MAG TPA: carboxypeptidase regulatory-like domain-containing protein [Terracidiphilus sp.]|nr:carboxypeptidase regulatory-like domain-containing protein [Terracidiphilus sp.]
MHALDLSLSRIRIGALCRITIAALVLLSGISLRAQIDTGSIVGIVEDKGEARVAGATVNVTNTATNVERSFVTNSDGQYEALQLIPGMYKVTVSEAGFSTQVRQNISVNVQSRVQVDFAMTVSAVQQQVVVNEEAAQLDTQSAQVAAVLSTETINQLPLNGRSYDQLALLEPGIYHNPSGEVANAAAGRFSSNGNLELQNYFSLDGIDNNTGSENLQEQSVQAVTPPPDALQEFALQTRTYSAEFGTSAGAVVNVSTKSGTNALHGDVWDYLENSALNANSWFNNYGGVPKGHFEQNQFGATIGGPIVRNHTFFFASYETLLSREAQTVTSTVPTPAMKTGDFTSVLASHPMTATAQGQTGCITANVIAPGCIDPVGQAILNLFPDPSPQLGDVNVFTGAPNYEYVTSVPNDTRTLIARIDHTLNAKNQLFGRYANDVSDYSTAPWTANPIAGNGEFSTDYILHDQSLALGWTDSISSSLVNTAHFGFLRDYSHSDPVGLKVGVSDAPEFGLTGIPVSAVSAGIPANYLFGLTTIGTAIYRPQFQVAQVFQVVDDVYKLIGKHSLQFGYEYHQNSLNFFDLEAPQGALLAEGVYTNTPGFGVGDYLLGDITEAILENALEVNNYMRGNSFYGQDTYRVNPNLTVNFGLRYELYPPFWLNRDNRTANFSPDNGGEMVSAASGGTYSRALVHPDDVDFAPRFGFSYHMFKPLVIRGGYGVFHQFVNRIGSESMLQLNPPFLLDDSLSQPFGSTTPVFQLKNGFPSAALQALGVSLPSLQLRAQDPNERTTYVEQASFGPQFQVSSNTLLNATWIGNWARKMNRLRNANQGVVTDFSGTTPIVTFPYANLNTEVTALGGAGQHAFLELATNDGNTDYNALELSLKRDFSHGLMYQLSYTWAHNMADFVDNLTGGSTPQNAYDYAHEMSNSPQDVRHRFVGSAAWALPVGRGGLVMNNDSIASKLIGGWQANAIVSLQTGIPFDVSASDLSDTGSNHAAYANCVGDAFSGASKSPSQYVGSNSPGFFINVNAFAQPGLGTFGGCRPRAWHGPGVEQEDLSLFKSFPMGEQRRIEFRAEFFNAFNHPSFANPSASISAPGAFGKSTATTTNARQIQLVGKFYF